MGELSARSFGLLIAFVVPGFVGLLGASLVSPTASTWLVGVGLSGPAIGGCLYVGLASIAIGMVASAVRWMLVDRALHATGVEPPRLDFASLPTRLAAFDAIVDHHYRYYQFYAGTLLILPPSHLAWRLTTGPQGTPGRLADILAIALTLILAAASRDALRKYYVRAALLLGTLEERTAPDDQRLPPRTEEDEPLRRAEESRTRLDRETAARASPTGPRGGATAEAREVRRRRRLLPESGR